MWRLNMEKEKIIIETNNDPTIIDTLKPNTYFRYKCVSCGRTFATNSEIPTCPAILFAELSLSPVIITVFIL